MIRALLAIHLFNGQFVDLSFKLLRKDEKKKRQRARQGQSALALVEIAAQCRDCRAIEPPRQTTRRLSRKSRQTTNEDDNGRRRWMTTTTDDRRPTTTATTTHHRRAHTFLSIELANLFFKHRKEVGLGKRLQKETLEQRVVADVGVGVQLLDHERDAQANVFVLRARIHTHTRTTKRTCAQSQSTRRAARPASDAR